MSTPTTDPLPVLGDRIVGRRAELDALRTWLEGVSSRAGRIVLCAGEAGMGKTRLAQELAGAALARGAAVAWGRCVEAEGVPAFWPWRQVLRSLRVDADTVLGGGVESPEDRFRLFDDVTQAVCAAATRNGLVVILDDIHWGDEPSLLVLRQLADQTVGAPVLIFATFRHGVPAGALPRVLPDLLRAPGAQRLDLRAFDLAEVRQQLSMLTEGGSAPDPRTVLDVTGGNPLFVREVARAMADGTWHPDRPPRTVLDVVSARLDRVSAGCRRLVQAAAIVGRDVPIALLAAVLDEAVARCLPLVDEAIAHGLLDRVGEAGDYRFVHTLTRDAVEASLTTADRAALHRAVAEAMEDHFAGDVSEHVADIARHWAALAPLGEAATARTWAVRAADDAVHRLAFEEGVRLYRAALALDARAVPYAEHHRVLVALGRACNLARRPPWLRGRRHRGRRSGARRPATRPGRRRRARARSRYRAKGQCGGEGAGRGGARRPRPLGSRGDAGPAAVATQPPGVLRQRPGTGRGLERHGPRPGPGIGRRSGARRRVAGPQGGLPRSARPRRAALPGHGDAGAGPADRQRPHGHVGQALAHRRTGGEWPVRGRRRRARRSTSRRAAGPARCVPRRARQRRGGHVPGPRPARPRAWGRRSGTPRRRRRTPRGRVRPGRPGRLTGFVAEARYHLAVARLARNAPGDRQQAASAARDADRLARALGMTAYLRRTAALVTQLGADERGVLSQRELEVAELVARG